MKCPVCQTDMFIRRAEYEFEGDNSADTQTRVMHRPVFACVNKQCTEFGREHLGQLLPLF